MYLLCAIIDVPARGPVNCVNPNRCMMSEVGFKQEVQWSNPINADIRKERTDNCTDNGNILDHSTKEVQLQSEGRVTKMENNFGRHLV